MKFPCLFEPISIGKVTLSNRIAMAPMGIIGLLDRDGGFKQEAIDYYAERAFGGVGLIITGVTKATEIEPIQIPFVSRNNLRAFAELAEVIHFYNTKIFVQLTAGFGRVIFADWSTEFRPFSASAIPAYWQPHVTTKALSVDEVEGIVRALGDAGRLLKEAGIDGIELHGHEGYLLDQFATSIWNKRNDKYGGNLEDRLRFAIEILNSIKDNAGADFPVTYRFGLKHYMKAPRIAALKGESYVEAGRDIEEGLEMAKLLEKAGYDALHVDAGSYDSWYWAHPPNYQSHGCLVDMAENVKKVVHIPVITVGRLDIPELAEQVLKDGKADIVALGRGLLADPHWPKKAHEGKTGEIRPCLACRDGCGTRMLHEHKSISCSVNPATGRERLHVLQRVGKATKIIIAGGGIAGMEAARISAIRGCHVILYEKGEKLGGHLIAASVPDFKQDVARLLNWYNTELQRLAVKIFLKTEATPELIKREMPDKVFVATGSIPIVPNIPGIDKPNVATCIDLLLGKRRAGKRVVVVGGGLVGCETALWLLSQGKQVVLIEALSEMAMGEFESNRAMLLDMLKANNVESITNTTLEEIIDDGVKVIDRNFNKRTIFSDTIALAVGLKPRRELYDSLSREISDLYLIGDCKVPRRIRHAVWDGYHIAERD